MKTIIVKTHAQLDTLVAEEVMGWKWAEVSKDYDRINEGRRLVPKNFPSDYKWMNKGKIDPIGMCPIYSIDISLAWQVAEKMKGSMHLFRGKKFGCVFSAIGEDFTASGDTAPLAICLCALASVGIEVKLEIAE